MVLWAKNKICSINNNKKEKMNKVILIGNVGKDPEIFKTTENLQISKFSLATTKKRKGEDQTSWHNIITFGKLSEIVERFVKKGSKIALEGEIEYRSWENEGKKYYKTRTSTPTLNGKTIIKNN